MTGFIGVLLATFATRGYLEIAFLAAPRSPEVFYSLFNKMWVHCSNDDDETDNSNCRHRRRRCY